MGHFQICFGKAKIYDMQYYKKDTNKNSVYSAMIIYHQLYEHVKALKISFISRILCVLVSGRLNREMNFTERSCVEKIDTNRIYYYCLLCGNIS